MAEAIIVTGVIELDPANHDAAVEAFKAVMAPTQAEDGNEGYAFTAELDAPGKFRVFEQWRDQAAIDAHMGSEHLAALMGSMGTLGVTKAALTKWVGGTPEKLM